MTGSSELGSGVPTAAESFEIRVCRGSGLP